MSLLNILRLKGNPDYDELSLTKLCNALPGKGTTHENLVTAAECIGLECVEEKERGTVSDLERLIDGGNYVIINYLVAFSDSGHYTVVTNYDAEALYFYDCSYGFMRFEKEYLKKFWISKDSIPQWYAAFK